MRNTQRLRSAVVTGILIMLAGCYLPAQSSKPAFNEKITLQHAFLAFSDCIQSTKPECVTSGISSRGLFLGVDGPLLGNELHTATSRCAISKLALSQPASRRYGKPHVYEGHWQAEVIVRNSASGCPQETSFIFRLEEGYWKLVAIPYT